MGARRCRRYPVVIGPEDHARAVDGESIGRLWQEAHGEWIGRLTETMRLLHARAAQKAAAAAADATAAARDKRLAEFRDRMERRYQKHLTEPTDDFDPFRRPRSKRWTARLRLVRIGHDDRNPWSGWINPIPGEKLTLTSTPLPELRAQRPRWPRTWIKLLEHGPLLVLSLPNGKAAALVHNHARDVSRWYIIRAEGSPDLTRPVYIEGISNPDEPLSAAYRASNEGPQPLSLCHQRRRVSRRYVAQPGQHGARAGQV